MSRGAHIVTTGSLAVDRQMLQSKMSSSEVLACPEERSVAMLSSLSGCELRAQRGRSTEIASGSLVLRHLGRVARARSLLVG